MKWLHICCHYFPRRQQHQLLQEKNATRSWSADTRRSTLQYLDTTQQHRRVAGLLAWYWYGRNGHHNVTVINIVPLKQGIGWVGQKTYPLASLNRIKSTSKAQRAPNDCGGFLGFKGSKAVSGKMAERKEEEKPSGRNCHAARRHQGGYSELVT